MLVEIAGMDLAPENGGSAPMWGRSSALTVQEDEHRQHGDVERPEAGEPALGEPRDIAPGLQPSAIGPTIRNPLITKKKSSSIWALGRKNWCQSKWVSTGKW